MSAPAMRVDFIRGVRRDVVGRVLLAAGVLSIVTVVLAYRQLQVEAEGLQLRTQALDAIDVESSDLPERTAGTIAGARDVVTQLAMPWSRLLRDLDAAGNDNKQSVALLAIEPDVDHRQVRIVAESRDLPAALAYAERLQQSSALHFPLLVNHEVQSKDQYQPVRFEIAAEWQVTP